MKKRKDEEERERERERELERGMVKVLLAATGSVATVKVPELTSLLLEQNHQVTVVLSPTACHFVSKLKVQQAGSGSGSGSAAGLGLGLNEETSETSERKLRVYLEEDEWKAWKKMGDPVLHIDLAKWADVLLIAPLSANTLAKLANGLCDNLITSVARAWDYETKPVVCAPAMNTRMWNHPVTSVHCRLLKERDKIHFVDPVEKVLACGDAGIGAMAPTDVVAKEAIGACTGKGNGN